LAKFDGAPGGRPQRSGGGQGLSDLLPGEKRAMPLERDQGEDESGANLAADFF